MKVAITGSSGLLGEAVLKALRDRGDSVARVVRSREAAAAEDALFWDPDSGSIDTEALGEHDAVVGLAGENIAGIWTGGKKARIRDSRVGGTRILAEALAGLPPERRPQIFVSASGAHYFGDRPPDQPMTEESPPGAGFMADLVRDWEAAADPARQAGVRVVHLRFGVVLHPEALLLQATATATRFGVGAVLGSGEQGFPWITRDDALSAILFSLDRPVLEGPVNTVAPERTTGRDYADTLAEVLHRPRVLRIPRFAIRMLGDLGTDVVLAGSWVVPRKLEEAGFTWRDPALKPALRRLLT